jgi:hypothetical protein
MTVETDSRSRRTDVRLILPRRWIGGMVCHRHARKALPRANNPGTHCTGGLVGATVGLEENGSLNCTGVRIPNRVTP